MTGMIAQTDVAPNGVPTDESPLRDRLRKRRAELHSKEPIDLDLPGYNGELVARYRPLGWDAIEKLGSGEEGAALDLNAASDVLVAACESIFVRDDGTLYELNERFDLGPLPVRYDVRLAEFLGVEAGSARDVVRRVFNELDIPEHLTTLLQRSKGVRERVEDALEGESVAPRS